MFEVIAEDLVESRRVAGVLVSRNLVRRYSGNRHGGAEERLGGFLIARLAQVDIDQVAVAVDRPVQVLPLARDLDVRLIDIPTIAVGPVIADRPPHRSGRARFRHPAPILSV